MTVNELPQHLDMAMTCAIERTYEVIEERYDERRDEVRWEYRDDPAKLSLQLEEIDGDEQREKAATRTDIEVGYCKQAEAPAK